jgi:hypothetical protein
MTYIRYFATTDDSPTGKLALEYMKGMLRLGPVRVLSVTGGVQGGWVPYAQLLSTPMSCPFVNVVCCHSERWAWKQVIPTMDLAGAPLDTIEGRLELYTAGVRNVLLAGPDDPPHILSPAAVTSLRYEAIVVPSTRLQVHWAAMLGVGSEVLAGGKDAFAPAVIPVPVADHDAFRAAVLG